MVFLIKLFYEARKTDRIKRRSARVALQNLMKLKTTEVKEKGLKDKKPIQKASKILDRPESKQSVKVKTNESQIQKPKKIAKRRKSIAIQSHEVITLEAISTENQLRKMLREEKEKNLFLDSSFQKLQETNLGLMKELNESKLRIEKLTKKLNESNLMVEKLANAANTYSSSYILPEHDYF